MRVNDMISGALIVLLAVAMAAYTTTFPPFPGQKYGPSLFPRLLGAGLVLCGVLLILRGRRTRTAGEPLAALGETYATKQGFMSVLLILGVILFYILASSLLGFILTASLGVLTLLWWFGVALPRAALIAIIAVLVVDWFFGWLFRVPLPLGILPNSPSAAFMNIVRGK
jgi:putative tricarboxylic transport membrane protein